MSLVSKATFSKLTVLRHGIIVRRISLFGIPTVQRKIEFSDEKILGYSTQDVYSVVADINKYKDFLPWCKESEVIKQDERHCVANLAVGFPPLVEKYTSYVTFKPHSFVKSIANNGRLFTHMETTWVFHPGPEYISRPSTLVAMKTIFEFRSMLYASLGTPVFSEVARTLSQAFEARFEELYGVDHLSTLGKSSSRQRTVSISKNT